MGSLTFYPLFSSTVMSHPVHMVHLMTVDVVTELWEGGFGQGWDQEE